MAEQLVLNTPYWSEDGRYYVKLSLDDYAPNPRKEWDHEGVMVYKEGSDIELGDLAVDPETFTPPAGAVCIPVYAIIHSGVSVHTVPFFDPVDSGQCGWIYMPREVIEANHLSDDEAERWLEQEVKEFDAWLRGEVYMYTVYKKSEAFEDEFVDGCGGIYGYEYACECAMEALEDAVEEAVFDAALSPVLDVISE